MVFPPEGGILLDGENPVAKDLVSSQPMVCAWNARAARGEGIPRLQCGDGMEQGSTRSTGVVPSVPTLPPAAQLESFPPVFVIGCSNRGRCESGCRRRIGLSSCWEFRCYLHARKEVGRAECRVSQPEDTEHPSFFLHVPTNTSDVPDISIGGRPCGFQEGCANATATQPRPGGAMVCRKGVGRAGVGKRRLERRLMALRQLA